MHTLSKLIDRHFNDGESYKSYQLQEWEVSGSSNGQGSVLLGAAAPHKLTLL